MQSFSSDNLPASMLVGIGCGLEGNDLFARETRKLTDRLQWHALRVSAVQKALYHAANVFAGNFPVVLASIAERLLRASTSDEASLTHLLPMMRAVCERLGESGAERTLTGPAARGDIETIHRHRDALDSLDPGLRSLYDMLSDIASDIARDRQCGE
jgi:predicted short-subunit dehydrogenase-like oxidoreductase (DUF2520 family)